MSDDPDTQRRLTRDEVFWIAANGSPTAPETRACTMLLALYAERADLAAQIRGLPCPFAADTRSREGWEVAIAHAARLVEEGK